MTKPPKDAAPSDDAAPSNEAMIEYWNGVAGERWVAQQERLDNALGEITKAVMAFAAAQPGERALDIGCGCGTTSLMLAKAVAPKGKVAGVDISAPMLGLARKRSEAAEAKIAFTQADASTHSFEPEYDLVFSRFGVMFFADPVAAFANIRNALGPNGRLAFVCWRALPENIWAAAPFAAARAYLPPQEKPDPHAPGPFAFADAKRLDGILAKAGFRNVKIDALDSVMNMGADIEAAASEALNIGPVARAAAELDEAMRTKIRTEIAGALAKYKSDAGITPPAGCWLVSAGI